MTADGAARTAELVEALREIASETAIPDDWEPYTDPYGDYADYPTEPDQPRAHWSGVDDSNMGDVHGHGVEVGLWMAAKIARRALAATDTTAPDAEREE